ncbi:hypothetical protein Aglo03_25450 [Actinokineospora globicatena]|uniref:Uncharacterized protein n=1 Tax=Actinokineospora globicatena TaxID=103729 RepID=A0A9W6V989_9PSEU|nr:hypothetical protein Aglo03_25450 [Actinokineospora globicatena]
MRHPVEFGVAHLAVAVDHRDRVGRTLGEHPLDETVHCEHWHSTVYWHGTVRRRGTGPGSGTCHWHGVGHRHGGAVIHLRAPNEHASTPAVFTGVTTGPTTASGQ